MKTTFPFVLLSLLIGGTLLVTAASTQAASPESILVGRQLFEREWAPTNPQLGSDGLGPLFNGRSCVACHQQGGVGGSGDARFNANTLSIEWLMVSGGPVDQDVVQRLVNEFVPGFNSQNSLVLAHHGGSPQFQAARAAIKSKIDSQFSREGGSTNASEVRLASATPIVFHQQVGKYKISLRARLFQRNTTAMFGAGLIDSIDDKLIEAQAKLQQKHPEISGRPATLQSGKIGKFGWRANVASLLDFCDRACAAEVGLETKRKEQPVDPTMENYRNPSVDIQDQQIIAMRDFLAALPQPTREIPSDSKLQAEVAMGEQLFAAVGCAHCHVPRMGLANGIYSDMLLHDMGYDLMDLNPADPYIIRVSDESQVVTVNATVRERGMGTYYGGSSPMFVDRVSNVSEISSGSGRALRGRRSGKQKGYEFNAPIYPQREAVVPVGSRQFTGSMTQPVSQVGGAVGSFTRTTQGVFRKDMYLRLTHEPTKFNQEWRTAPLWGLRDSAPYMHDGRAETVLEAIVMHGGESTGTRDRFLQLSLDERRAVLAFLNTLVAPPSVPQPLLSQRAN